MSFLEQISVLILTYNEAPNIQRTLDALSSFSDVVVLDSGSNDGTIEILGRYANVRYLTRPFDTHAAQWSHGLTSCGIERPWVLALTPTTYCRPPWWMRLRPCLQAPRSLDTALHSAIASSVDHFRRPFIRL